MYRCFLINFGYFLQESKDSQEDAVVYGRSKGFEFTVFNGDEPVCTWSPIGGLRRFANG